MTYIIEYKYQRENLQISDNDSHFSE